MSKLETHQHDKSVGSVITDGSTAQLIHHPYSDAELDNQPADGGRPTEQPLVDCEIACHGKNTCHGGAYMIGLETFKGAILQGEYEIFWFNNKGTDSESICYYDYDDFN